MLTIHHDGKRPKVKGTGPEDLSSCYKGLKFPSMTLESPLFDFLHSLKGMFEQPEYHFPIVAAQYQYRERYYGLAGAAMLEDLFFDAFSGYLRKSEPSAALLRPPRGEKGYDYEFNGMKLSHKVSKLALSK